MEAREGGDGGPAHAHAHAHAHARVHRYDYQENRRAHRARREDGTDGVAAKPAGEATPGFRHPAAHGNAPRAAAAPHKRPKGITGKVTASGDLRLRGATSRGTELEGGSTNFRNH